MNDNSAPKQLHRSRDGRMVAGVCSGLGAYFDLDPNIVRLVFVIFSILGGAGVLLYVVGWLIIPEEGEETSIAQELINKKRA